MWLKKPINEWFTGTHYEYNKDQDRLNFTNNSSEFEKDEDYNDRGIITYGEDFRYKQYRDEKGRSYPLPNMSNDLKEYLIQTSNVDIKFKQKDKIKLIGSDKLFTIQNVSTNNKNYLTKATKVLPGLYDEYNSNQVLTIS